MEFLIIALLIGILGILVWTIIKKQSNDTAASSEEISQKVLISLTQNQATQIEKIIEKLNNSQLQQGQLLSENNQKIENRFSELQNKINTSFENQNQNQRLEFEKIKNSNQENLQAISLSVQERLSKAIADLVELNNKNFELLSKTNQDKLNQINLDVQKRLDENFAQNLKSVSEVTQKLGHIESTAQKMIESTKSVDKLNTIFSRTSSKAFGGFAENYLESLLAENLVQGSWQKQVKIPGSGEVLDFVIFVDDKKIGIDSKFPLTKWNDYLEAEDGFREAKRKEFVRAVVDMAKEISAKYYQQNYLDTLLLYLPSDSMYIEILDGGKNQEMLDLLNKLKVSLISPNTLFPQIMIIKAYQFKLQINQGAEVIYNGLRGLRKNIDGFREEFRKLGDKIRQAQTNYDQADRNLIGVERNVHLLETEKGEDLFLTTEE